MDLFGIKIDLGYLDGAHLNGHYAIFLDTYMIYAIVLTLFISFLLIAYFEVPSYSNLEVFRIMYNYFLIYHRTFHLTDLAF